MQKIWLSGADWDDELAPALKQKAVQWLSEIPEQEVVRILRCLQLKLDLGESYLHVFVDASKDAYGAIVYDVVSYKNDDKSSRLVASKSRVAPLKSVSIPRLELMAAVLGVKLVLAIVSALALDLACVVLWTDSQNVLFWIKNHSKGFKTFVAHRIGFIQEHTEPDQWKYIPSKLNVADLLSRGTTVSTLTTKTWMSGPSFLESDENDWPGQPVGISPPDNPERGKVKIPTVITMMTFLDTPWRLEPTRYSDWKKLIRVTAWVYRFLSNSQCVSELRQIGELAPEEIEDAERLIISQTQREVFAKEALALNSQKPLPSSSKLLSLNLFIDDDGILRCGGRLPFANVLPYGARFPIILPRRHWVTKLIVKRYHEEGKHVAGTNHILALLSSRYWIISGREEIREWEKNCAWCRKTKAKPGIQIMAPLPRSRVTHSLRAFDKAGVGPFLTVQGRGKQRRKRYLCLFTCLATRAVHLEMAYGLDSDSFLQAFYRMVCRRGLPCEMISDNGTNFVGAVKELKQLVADLDCNAVKSSLANRGVVWKFNPPHGPNFGGVYETMIKAAKRAIYAILGSGDISDEELLTAFTGAEALINSRPLTYQTVHPEDEVPLTPNHFLHGQIGGIFAPESVDAQTFNPRKRWRRIQELVKQFWKRWMKEWLPSLQARQKWFTPRRDLQVGDVVLVISQESPRGNWTLGKIIKTHPGQDGHVRVVDVKTNNRVLTRPVTKVCPLEWNE